MKDYRFQNCESALVLRASQGDAAAFELLCATHRPAIVALASRLLRSSDDANDAVQDTFVKAFRAIHAFNPDRPLRPWLCRICVNCCVDAVRAEPRGREPRGP